MPKRQRGDVANASDLDTPKRTRRETVLFTSAKEGHDKDAEEASMAVRNDRSARKKSRHALLRHTTPGADSDAEEETPDEAIARTILHQTEAEGDCEDEDMEDEEDDEDENEADRAQIATKTSSNPGRLRGRPKGRRRQRTPSPPPHLPPHELYFFHNRGGGNKTSANLLPAHLLLNHDDYNLQIAAYEDHHGQDIDKLKQLHTRAFDQWMFELEQGFNLCLYGYGSKRNLLASFAEHMYQQAEKVPSIVVVNGYTPGLTISHIVATLASVILPQSTAKLPAQAHAILNLLLSTLSESPPTSPLVLIINGLDHNNLRKPSTQSLIARLASHKSFSVLASCDTHNFPLLWDLPLTRQFRFLYHDATTFEPYVAELNVVDEANALLGRSGRRLGGKDGMGYVLMSLPENARNLFRILVAEQLALAEVEPSTKTGGLAEDQGLDSDDILGAEDEEEAASEQATPSRRARKGVKKNKAARQPPKPVPGMPHGVEYRTLYHKAVEDFICSSELNFRTLLKEFHDHQMIESRKDVLGTERLSIPFRRDELEAILEELV